MRGEGAEAVVRDGHLEQLDKQIAAATSNLAPCAIAIRKVILTS